MSATTSHRPPMSIRERAQLRQVAFTGRMVTMTRREAADAITRVGGHVTEPVSRRTSSLVVGMGGFPLTRTGAVSRKLLDAERLGVPIVSETRFRELLGLRRSINTRKTFRRSEAAALLDTDVRTLQRWEAMGLIEASHDRFDFQDLVSLRAIAELLGRGVRAVDIALGIRQLARSLPDTQRPLSQLRVVEQFGELAAELGEAFIAADGQWLLNFESATREVTPAEPVHIEHRLPSDRSASDWVEAGWIAEDQGDLHAACDAYRRAIACDTHAIEAHFNLGNVLRQLGDTAAAANAFTTAVSIDPTFADAWYNLADVQAASGNRGDAIASLNRAVQADPSFADAHYNLATLLDESGRPEDAALHWRAYLDLDPMSEWALEARRRLAR